ncbi:MAG: ribosome biogenesis GTPase Der [Actinomycetota bacterium]
MSTNRPILPEVAVVGRANVGKSTLVNRLCGKRSAIVDEASGVTRDRVEHTAQWRGRDFTLVDTGGFEPHSTDALRRQVVEQTRRALSRADLVLFVVDGQAGLTEEDMRLARELRRAEAPVLLVATKVDAAEWEDDLPSLYRAGLGEPWPVSGIHGRGTGDLLDAVVRLLPAKGSQDQVEVDSEGPVSVALIGRPNVGKSSLFNRLCGQERAIVHPQAGTTRDAVDSVLVHGGKSYRFIDTAGLSRKGRQAAGADYFALVRSLRIADEADVTVLILEANRAGTDQDLRLARRVMDVGSGLVIVLNKADLLVRGEIERAREDLAYAMPFAAFAPVVVTSALTGRGAGLVWKALERVDSARRQRVKTGRFNEWLTALQASTPPPPCHGKSVRVLFGTQSRSAPPEFVFFATGPVEAPYRRFLQRSVREAFGFEGVPVRVVTRVRKRKTERE